LQTRQVLVTTLNIFHFIGVCAFIVFTLVPGFAIVVVPPGDTAVPHAVFALGGAFAAFAVAQFSRFEIGLDPKTFERGIFYCYMALAAGIIVNGLFAGFLIAELVQASSDFYTQSNGYLIATLVVTFALIAVELFLVGACYVLLRDFKKALEFGWRPQYKKVDDVDILGVDNEYHRSNTDSRQHLLQSHSKKGGYLK